MYLQDIQAEIDAHNDIYKNVEGNKSKMVKALGSSDEAVFLQHRLDDMNQRWSDLKAKSANIRSVKPHRILVLAAVFVVRQLGFQCSALNPGKKKIVQQTLTFNS